MKLSQPTHMVTAEDVKTGKPNPECYLLGKDRLDLTADAKVLVVEDAIHGIRAGKAAGCKILGLATTHDLTQLKTAGADWIVEDLRSIRLVGTERGSREVTIEIWNALDYVE